jgi:glycosyltransferase involved in cell wall biosynthesis
LEEKVRAAGAGSRITLTGHVSHAEAQKWFRRATVFVLNSRYEGLSHTLLEACAAGAPVITTNVGGNPEVITDDKNGILVEPGNVAALERALALVMQDTQLRERLSAAARARAQEFSIEKTVKETAGLLRSSVS